MEELNRKLGESVEKFYIYEVPPDFKPLVCIQPTVTIFSDGACDNAYVVTSTNFGAWCVIVECGGVKGMITGYEENTTNNRMEIMGIKSCLSVMLPRGYKDIKIVTDSQYVEKMFKKLPKNYYKECPNKDIWHTVYRLMERYFPHITVQWVRGHNGHAENESCNEVAEKIVQDFVGQR